MYTAIAIFVSVPENIGQDCLKKWFCHQLVIFLEKINISYVLLLIHEVNVVSTLKGYMWSHFLLVMEKWPTYLAVHTLQCKILAVSYVVWCIFLLFALIKSRKLLVLAVD